MTKLLIDFRVKNSKDVDFCCSKIKKTSHRWMTVNLCWKEEMLPAVFFALVKIVFWKVKWADTKIGVICKTKEESVVNWMLLMCDRRLFCDVYESRFTSLQFDLVFKDCTSVFTGSSECAAEWERVGGCAQGWQCWWSNKRDLYILAFFTFRCAQTTGYKLFWKYKNEVLSYQYRLREAGDYLLNRTLTLHHHFGGLMPSKNIKVAQ